MCGKALGDSLRQWESESGVGVTGRNTVIRVTRGNAVTRDAERLERNEEIFIYYSNRLPDPFESIEILERHYHGFFSFLKQRLTDDCVLDAEQLGEAFVEYLGEMMIVLDALHILEYVDIDYDIGEYTE